MNLRSLRPRAGSTALIAGVLALASAFVVVSAASAQEPEHGRKYKPAPATSHITVTVHKGFNDKPMMNAAVIFHATKDGRNDGNLEVKTDEEGKAVIDVIEIGSKVTVQVIANGFATSAQEMDVDGPTKDLLVKMQRPRAQVSKYTDSDGQASQVKPGIQEPSHTAPPPPPPPTPTTPPQQ